MLRSALLAAIVASNVAATIPIGPPGNAFYVPPARLPADVDGTVIWARTFTGGSSLPSAAVNYRVLYETVAANGTFVAVSGTVAIPRGAPPAGGWPIISWAHGTVGDAPQCAPSRSAAPNIEQRMLDGFVGRGYAVAQTDYEGNGTPGIHPYFVATSSARDVTDIVRAAREIDPQIGRDWIVMGHSEGGAAALATAALAPQWAPELHLAGAVAYAPGSHLQDILQNEILNDTPNEGTVFLGLMIAGFSSADPRIVPSAILEPDALQLMPALQQRCVDDLERDSGWRRIAPNTIFRQGANLDTFYHDLLANDPENFVISVPTFIVQGDADALVPSEMTVALRDALCRNGAPVTFRAYVGATHGTVLATADADVSAWIAQRLAGTPDRSRC